MLRTHRQVGNVTKHWPLPFFAVWSERASTAGTQSGPFNFSAAEEVTLGLSRNTSNCHGLGFWFSGFLFHFVEKTDKVCLLFFYMPRWCFALGPCLDRHKKLHFMNP